MARQEQSPCPTGFGFYLASGFWLLARRALALRSPPNLRDKPRLLGEIAGQARNDGNR